MGSGREAFLAATAPFRKLTLDTNIFLYYLANESRFADLVTDLMLRAITGGVVLELPGIVQFELLIRPYQSGDPNELANIRKLVRHHPGIEASAISDAVLQLSAEIRARTRLKAPDALVAGSAMMHGSAAIVSNDKNFYKLKDLENVDFITQGRRRLTPPQFLLIDDFADKGA